MRYDQLCALIIDDNQHMRAIIAYVLRALDIRKIVSATDGAEALEVMKTNQIDFAFVDYQMRPVDGIEFTRFLRTAADSPNRHLPIIMMTGHTERQVVAEARDAGVDEFLAKPVNASTIYARTRAVLTRRRAFIESLRFIGPDRRRGVARSGGVGRRLEDKSPPMVLE